MNQNKKIIFFLILLTSALLLRDLPYFNILFINKIWIAYILLFFLLLPPSSPKKLFYLVIPFLILALFFTLLKFSLAAEILGIVIYFILWVALVLELASLRRKT